MVSQKSGLPTLADDGGLEIAVLDGEPGVKSRRWINGVTESSDDELIGYTLGRLYGKSGKDRHARMRIVVTLALPNGQYWQAGGVVKGIIAERPSGKRVKCYPYRSIFYLPQIGKYYQNALMTIEEQNKFNHRKKAIEKLKKVIQVNNSTYC